MDGYALSSKDIDTLISPLHWPWPARHGLANLILGELKPGQCYTDFYRALSYQMEPIPSLSKSRLRRTGTNIIFPAN